MVTRIIAALPRTLNKRSEGQALVEFALVAPIFLLLVLGVVEFGRAWQVSQTLTDAARAGCRVAVVYNTNTTIDTVSSRMNANMAAARLDTASAVKTVTGYNPSTGQRTASTGDPAVCSITYPYQLRWIQGIMGWTGAQAALTMNTFVTFRFE